MSFEDIGLSKNNNGSKEDKEMDKPLDLKGAQEEANMIRVIASGGRESYKEFAKPRTKEEYDKALEVLEKMREMAEKEPTSEKVLSEIARLSITSGYGVMCFLKYLGTALANPVYTLAGKDIDPFSYITPLEKKRLVLRSLESASAKLKVLRTDAKELGERQHLQSTGVWTKI